MYTRKQIQTTEDANSRMNRAQKNYEKLITSNTFTFQADTSSTQKPIILAGKSSFVNTFNLKNIIFSFCNMLSSVCQVCALLQSSRAHSGNILPLFFLKNCFVYFYHCFF